MATHPAAPASSTVKIVNTSPHPLPTYESAAAAGLDLRAYLPEGPLRLAPLCRILVPTGLHIELPLGYEAQLRPRSGLALKHGLTLLNSPGTVDADYRGEIRILMVNLSDQEAEITDGMRVAQLVFSAHGRVVWQQVAHLHELAPSQRSHGGFGSTGQ